MTVPIPRPHASYIPPPAHPAVMAYAATMPITAVTFSNDGTQLFVGGYHEVTVWNPADGGLIRRIANVGQRTFALALSPDGTLLAVGCGTPGRLGKFASSLPRRVIAKSSAPQRRRLRRASARRVTKSRSPPLTAPSASSSGRQQNFEHHQPQRLGLRHRVERRRIETRLRQPRQDGQSLRRQNGELLITHSATSRRSGASCSIRTEPKSIPPGATTRSPLENRRRRQDQRGRVRGESASSPPPAGSSSPPPPSKRSPVQGQGTSAVREYPGAKDWVLSAAFSPTKRIAGAPTTAK